MKQKKIQKKLNTMMSILFHNFNWGDYRFRFERKNGMSEAVIGGLNEAEENDAEIADIWIDLDGEIVCRFKMKDTKSGIVSLDEVAQPKLVKKIAEAVINNVVYIADSDDIFVLETPLSQEGDNVE